MALINHFVTVGVDQPPCGPANTLARFLLFAGDDYDSLGGWDDFDSWHEALDTAIAQGKALSSGDWFHVVDLHARDVVARYRKNGADEEWEEER